MRFNVQVPPIFFGTLGMMLNCARIFSMKLKVARTHVYKKRHTAFAYVSRTFAQGWINQTVPLHPLSCFACLGT